MNNYFSSYRERDMTSPVDRLGYLQESSTDTETDYKDTDGRGRRRTFNKNRMR